MSLLFYNNNGCCQSFAVIPRAFITGSRYESWINIRWFLTKMRGNTSSAGYNIFSTFQCNSLFPTLLCCKTQNCFSSENKPSRCHGDEWLLLFVLVELWRSWMVSTSSVLFFSLRRSLPNDGTSEDTQRSGDVCAPQQIAAVSLYSLNSSRCTLHRILFLFLLSFLFFCLSVGIVPCLCLVSTIIEDVHIKLARVDDDDVNVYPPFFSILWIRLEIGAVITLPRASMQVFHFSSLSLSLSSGGIDVIFFVNIQIFSPFCRFCPFQMLKVHAGVTERILRDRHGHVFLLLTVDARWWNSYWLDEKCLFNQAAEHLGEFASDTPAAGLLPVHLWLEIKRALLAARDDIPWGICGGDGSIWIKPSTSYKRSTLLAI